MSKSSQVQARTILVSEDNGPILKLVSTVARKMGYDVLEARSSEDALAEASGRKGGISLHIADINLPGLDGRDLHRRILETHPGAKCILMSGYPREHVEGNGGIPDWAEFLQKPFATADLVSTLKKAMGEELSA